MSFYGHVGVTPLAPMSNSPERQLALLLKQKYPSDEEDLESEGLKDIKFSDIEYEKWFSGYGDIAIYFEDAGHSNISMSVDHNIQDFDHYTDIHLFVRSMKTDYDNSAEKKAFDLEQWIIKTIIQNNEALASGGIQQMVYENTRVLPYFMGDRTNYDNLVYRKVLSVCMKIRLINKTSTG